jgi:hypothetical protein
VLLGEEQTLWVFENRLLKEGFKRKKEDVMGYWRNYEMEIFLHF